MEERTTYCITNWNAFLKVEEILEPTRKYKVGLMRVSDPDARDAGMYISHSEVKALIHIRTK